MDVQKSSNAFEMIREVMNDESLLDFFGSTSSALGTTFFLIAYFCKNRVKELRKEDR